MSDDGQGRIIQVPNTLKVKVGGRLSGLDPAAVAKAEAALKSLSENFGAWLQDEIDKVEAARTRIKAEGMTAETAEHLYLRAHDLKGLGSTYDFPLITRIAGSLCKLIDDPETRVGAPLFLIDAHIDAIKAAVRDNIRDAGHPIGKVLIETLEEQVRKHLG